MIMGLLPENWSSYAGNVLDSYYVTTGFNPAASRIANMPNPDGGDELRPPSNGSDDDTTVWPASWGWGGGSSGPTDEQRRQKDRTIAGNKLAAQASWQDTRRNLAALRRQQAANDAAYKQTKRTYERGFNGQWFEQELKGQAGHNALANSGGNGFFGSTFLNGLQYLTGLNRDIYTNEVLRNKIAALNDLNVNKYMTDIENMNKQDEALRGNEINVAKYKAAVTADVDSIMAELADKYYVKDSKKNGGGYKVDTSKADELKYLEDISKWNASYRKNYLSDIPQLETVNYIRPDGPNQANSNPLVNRIRNTNTFNNAGTVAKSTNRNDSNRVAYLKASSTGYDYRDENPKMTQIETGR